MSRIDGGDGFGFAAQARFAAEQAQLEARRQAELQRAQALAAELRASLEAAQGPSPEVLGRVLAEAQRLLPEAREALARNFALEPAPTSVSSPPESGATLLQAAVDKACPPGSESRQSLGAALLRAAGLGAHGVGPGMLETAVSRALQALAPRAPTASRPAGPMDVRERAEPRRIGDPPSAPAAAIASSAPSSSALSSSAPSRSAPPAPAAARPAEARVVSTNAPAAAGGFVQPMASAVSAARAHPAEAQRLADAASDLQALRQVLGGAEPMAVASASSAVGPVEATSVAGDAGVVSAVASRLFGIERLSWEGTAPKLLGPRLEKVSGSLGTLYDKTEGIRQALVMAESRRASVHLGLHVAAGQLDTVAHKLGIARELGALREDSRSSLRGVVGAREALSGVGSEAGRALETLSGLSVHGLPRAMSEIREVARLARANENELRTSYAEGAMLEQIDAGAGLFAEPAAEPVPGAVSAEDLSAGPPTVEGVAEGPGVLAEEDLARLGSALDPSKPAAQGVWTEGMVNTVAELGRKQGGVTDADGARHFEIARMALGAEGTSLEGPGHELAPADLLAVLKMAGVPLEKIDPNQLASAARYVSSATSLADQQDKLRKTLDNFQVLATTGLPKMDRQLMVEQLWAMAKVPGHALQKLSDAEIQRKFQEVATALNGGPGPSQIKIGSHNLKLEVSEAGQVLSSSCKKPGFFSKVWNVVKTVAPIALTVASFAFPTFAPIAKLIQAGLSAVEAIKSKSLLGIATAGASMLGAGAKVFGGLGAAADKVARVANSVARGLQGVSSIRSGNVLGGIASLGSAVAGGLANGADKIGSNLHKVADKLNTYSTKLSAVASGVQGFRSYQSAGKAVDQARRALAQARLSGDARAIAAAEAQLRQAESQKRTSLFGAAAGALQGASQWVGDRGLFPGDAKPGPAAGLEAALRIAGRGLGVVRDVSAGDFASAAVGGLAVASNIGGAGRPADQARGGDLTDLSRMADAGLDYYRSQQDLKAAEKSVADAESRLLRARASGDASAIGQAEAGLREARRGQESAVMGDLAAGQGAIETAAAVSQERSERSRSAAEAAAAAARAKDPKYAEALEKAGSSQAEGAFVGKLMGEWAQDAALPEEARAVAAQAAATLDGAHAELEKAKRDGADAATLERLARTLDETSQAARQLNERIEATVLAADAAAKAASGPAFAALRPKSFFEVPIQRDLTVWEVSMRTGIPVDRIVAFNKENGNEIDPKRLPIGGKLMVPDEEPAFQPRSAEQVLAMQRAAMAERRATEQVGGALGIPGITADEAKQLQGLLQQLQTRNVTAAAGELSELLASGTPRLKQFAREQIGRLEADRLKAIQHLNTAKITEIGEAVKSATNVESKWALVNPLRSVGLLLGHDDNIRTIANERQATIQDQSMGVGAIQRLRDTTGLTLGEIGKMTPAVLDEALARANPQLDRTHIALMRGSVMRSLGNPDVAAIAQGQFNFGTYSWEKGKVGANIAFAAGLLDDLTRPVAKAAMGALADAAQGLGEGVRNLRAGAELAKSSSSFYESYSGHFVGTSLDYISDANRFTLDSVKYAQEYWTKQGGVTGWVGDKLAAAGGLVISPLTSAATLVDHRASGTERMGAIVEVGLTLATAGLARAGVGSLASAYVKRQAAAFTADGASAAVAAALRPATRLAGQAASATGRLLTSNVDDLAARAGTFTLRQGSRAVDGLTSAAGRAVRSANEAVFKHIDDFVAKHPGLTRTADTATDVFHWANNFGHGRVMTTGAEILERTGLKEIQAKHAAAKIYEGIRSSVDDVARIAKTSSMPEFQIARIKDHVFNKLHKFDDGLRRFDPSQRIAEAWKRLESGVKGEGDLAMLRHELVESRFEGMFGHDFARAHAAAGEALSVGRRIRRTGSLVPDPDFVGILKMQPIQLTGVRARTFTYVKRAESEAAALRKAFDTGARPRFIRHLATDADTLATLRAAGVSEQQVSLMALHGKVPTGWQVHHKYPLDDGGNNHFGNLVLMRNDPFHKALTNAQRSLTHGLRVGEARVVQLPMPRGLVYPPPRP